MPFIELTTSSRRMLPSDYTFFRKMSSNVVPLIVRITDRWTLIEVRFVKMCKVYITTSLLTDWISCKKIMFAKMHLILSSFFLLFLNSKLKLMTKASMRWWQGCAAKASLSKEDAAFICVQALDNVPQKGLVFEVRNMDCALILCLVVMVS